MIEKFISGAPIGCRKSLPPRGNRLSVTTPGMKEHVDEILGWFWRDNVKAKVMQPDGVYQLRETSEPPFDAQAEFIAEAPAPAQEANGRSCLRCSLGWSVFRRDEGPVSAPVG